MSEVLETVSTRRLFRLWDSEYRLIGEYRDEIPAEELIEGRNVTVDYSNGRRWSGRIHGGALVQDIEFLEVFQWPKNPFL